jgi:leucyl-tRNA synthetase
MRGTLKTIRDAEIALLKRTQKGKGRENALFDPKKPKAVRIYMATKFRA